MGPFQSWLENQGGSPELKGHLEILRHRKNKNLGPGSLKEDGYLSELLKYGGEADD